MRSPRRIVAVLPGSALEDRRRLFAALEAAFPVSFTPWVTGMQGAAALSFSEEPDVSRLRMPVLAFAPDADGEREAVELRAAPGVDRRVWGITVADRLARPQLTPAAGDEVLAVQGRAVAWVRSSLPVPVQRVRAALPELEPGEILYSLLGKRPLALIALVQFLRELAVEDGWSPPPLRASIVFDDPNLRWRSYGFIDYRRLLAHAERHDYHAAMAMIPLDAGWAHAPTVSLFRQRRDRLSVVFHGNNHFKGELMAPHNEPAALAMTAQALRRIARFEQRWHLPVDRVMMPPHGLCSRHVVRALAAFGFDALFAIHALPWTERPPAGPPLAGWWPGEFIDGCAVIPRVPLSSSHADIALRAFLDHPIVLYGHHDDLAGGLDALARAAQIVNGLGDTRWMSAGDVATSNYTVREIGDILAVRPFGRRIRLAVTPQVRAVRVEAPGDVSDAAELTGWSIGAGPALPFGAAAPLAEAGAVDIRLRARAELLPGDMAAPAWRPWPRVRRAATEARDRMLPLRPIAGR